LASEDIMIKRSLLLSLLLATGAVQAQDKAAAQPDLAKAKQTAEQVCGACHGADGNSQIPVNPKLAGQHAEYLYKQLKNFKSEGGAPAERANPIMAGMAAGLSDADMQGLVPLLRWSDPEARICQEQGVHRSRPEAVACG
jgi:cytochrome c553